MFYLFNWVLNRFDLWVNRYSFSTFLFQRLRHSHSATVKLRTQQCKLVLISFDVSSIVTNSFNYSRVKKDYKKHNPGLAY